MNNKMDLQGVHQFIYKNNKILFEEKKKEHDYLDFFRNISKKDSNDLCSMIPNIEKFKTDLKEYGKDEESPLSEYLYYILNETDDVLEDAEYKEVIENKKPIWHLKPKKVANLISNLNLSSNDFIKRIRNEFILENGLGITMARSEDNTENDVFYTAATEFALKKEEHKRDTFINELQQHFK